MQEFKSSNWEVARAYCDEAITNNPEDSAAYLIRGRISIEEQKFHEAIDDFSAAIRYDPNNPASYHHRAFAYRSTGDQQRARRDRRAARLNDPTFEKSHPYSIDNQNLDPEVDLAQQMVENLNSPEVDEPTEPGAESNDKFAQSLDLLARPSNVQDVLELDPRERHEDDDGKATKAEKSPYDRLKKSALSKVLSPEDSMTTPTDGPIYRPEVPSSQSLYNDWMVDVKRFERDFDEPRLELADGRFGQNEDETAVGEGTPRDELNQETSQLPDSPIEIPPLVPPYQHRWLTTGPSPEDASNTTSPIFIRPNLQSSPSRSTGIQSSRLNRQNNVSPIALGVTSIMPIPQNWRQHRRSELSVDAGIPVSTNSLPQISRSTAKLQTQPKAGPFRRSYLLRQNHPSAPESPLTGIHSVIAR